MYTNKRGHLAAPVSGWNWRPRLAGRASILLMVWGYLGAPVWGWNWWVSTRPGLVGRASIYWWFGNTWGHQFGAGIGGFPWGPSCRAGQHLLMVWGQGLVLLSPVALRIPLPAQNPENGSFWIKGARIWLIFGRLLVDLKLHHKSTPSKSLPKSKKSSLGPPLDSIWRFMFDRIFRFVRNRCEPRKTHIFTVVFQHPLNPHIFYKMSIEMLCVLLEPPSLRSDFPYFLRSYAKTIDLGTTKITKILKKMPSPDSVLGIHWRPRHPRSASGHHFDR